MFDINFSTLAARFVVYAGVCEHSPAYSFLRALFDGLSQLSDSPYSCPVVPKSQLVHDGDNFIQRLPAHGSLQAYTPMSPVQDLSL